MKLFAITTCSFALALTACGDAKQEAGSGSIAKALAYESPERAAAKKADEDRLATVAAERARARAKAEALNAAIEEVAALPEDMPPDMAQACDRLVNAYEQFMRDNRDAEIVMLWFNEKSKNLSRERVVCRKTNLRAAACVANALENRPDALLDLGDPGVDKLKAACAAKFGVNAVNEPAGGAG